MRKAKLKAGIETQLLADSETVYQVFCVCGGGGGSGFLRRSEWGGGKSRIGKQRDARARPNPYAKAAAGLNETQSNQMEQSSKSQRLVRGRVKRVKAPKPSEATRNRRVNEIIIHTMSAKRDEQEIRSSAIADGPSGKPSLIGTRRGGGEAGRGQIVVWDEQENKGAEGRVKRSKERVNGGESRAGIDSDGGNTGVARKGGEFRTFGYQEGT
ncbi:hypothetical protein B0H17DRAFT_1231019 [Mycena rosella]|uniref:Uncharacterized protein n=1 Tax=Mycena rosella TaxID=1033263 RepID=A0AAD7D9S4_MYCRO|nr:hypothetical protein B0H17DRAFT_1231019 [Mycena rosella]